MTIKEYIKDLTKEEAMFLYGCIELCIEEMQRAGDDPVDWEVVSVEYEDDSMTIILFQNISDQEVRRYKVTYMEEIVAKRCNERYVDI